MISIDRSARMVSLHRRTGTQLSYDEICGRHQRHARTWRDLQSDDAEHLRVTRGTIIGSAIGAIMWGALIVLMTHL